MAEALDARHLIPSDQKALLAVSLDGVWFNVERQSARLEPGR